MIVFILSCITSAAMWGCSFFLGANADTDLTRITVPNVVTEGTVIPINPISTPTVEPTPTPDFRVEAINNFVYGSYLEGLGESFVYWADVYGNDPRLMVALGYYESTLCKFSYGAYNCWGYGPGIDFDSYEDGIATVNRTFASYEAGTQPGLCIWQTGRPSCDTDHVRRVLSMINLIY